MIFAKSLCLRYSNYIQQQNKVNLNCLRNYCSIYKLETVGRHFSNHTLSLYISERLASSSDKENKVTHTPSDIMATSTNDKDYSQTNGSSSTPKFTASKEELKNRLTPIQYQVTQLKATERPYTGEYTKFDKRGTYHCVVCDEQLFKSETKFESGCGWPAFFDSIDKDRLKFVQDYSLVGASDLFLLRRNPDLVRTEVLCKNCDAHLGHVFDDGPISKGGKRYCINSASLKFRPWTDKTS